MEIRNLAPRKDGGVGAVLADGSAVKQPWGDVFLAGESGLPEPEAPEGVRRNRLTRFDLYGMEGGGAGFDEGVNLVAFLVTQKMEDRSEAGVGLGFEQFRDDPVFKKGTAKGMRLKVREMADAQKPTGQPGVAESRLKDLFL